MKTLINTLLFATLFFNAKAQTNLAVNQCNLQPITFGDKIPNQIWNKSYPTINKLGQPFLKLRDYGNKLIILDFWATYYHPCIESLDYLDSIQHEFKDDLVVVPVLINDYIERAPAFIKKKGYKWPCIVGDTTLAKTLLRDYYIGFGTMWIKDGKLLAAPTKVSLNAETIKKVIKGEPVQFSSRKKTVKPKVAESIY